MAAVLSPSRTHLLSTHSSNPLHVRSSDPANVKYRADIAPLLAPTTPPEDSEMEEDDDNGDTSIELGTTPSYPGNGEDILLDAGAVDANDEMMDDAQYDEQEGEEGPQSDPIWASGESSAEQRMWIEDEDGHDQDEEDEDAGENAEDEDESSFVQKTPNEQAEILAEMLDLSTSVPELADGFRLVDRLGEGTFSSVYKAEDLKYEEHLNSYWLGHHPPHSSAYYQTLPPQKNKRGQVYVAIKRIYVTSSPIRIENELTIMEELRGCRHVAQLMTAFRQEDQVVAIMPFHRNQDFRNFYRILPLSKIQNYFRCLFRALKDIHARSIIHRDVKPANFLYDPVEEVGTLCDFGLAQRAGISTQSSANRCLHTRPDRENPHGKFSFKDASSRIESAKAKYVDAQRRANLGPEKVGYPTADNRPSAKANRAGTRGFRAPEVLLKCLDQTVALDVWSAGVVLLSFLVGKFPVFNSNDDVEALMEIAAIYGKEAMARCAYLHNRTFLTNVPAVEHPGTPLPELVRKLNPTIFTSPSTDQTLLGHALDLLPRLLHLDCTHRITSARALEHPFLLDRSQPEDTVVPHVIGEGVCGKAHWQDDMDEVHTVRVQDQILRLRAGEGVPIGREPCEIHRDKGWTEEGPGDDHGVYDFE